jgi:CubicO group peptidase (beta-lactamase class C family)
MQHLLTLRALAAPVALAVALTPLIAAAAPGRAQTADRASRIDTYVRGRMPDLRTPGLSLVVVDDGQVLISRGYGLADRDAGIPMTEDTPVAIASTSKGMTALAMMQLVEQGVVDLDAPVTRYLPEFNMDDERAAHITVRQVLSHTAGIPASVVADLGPDDQALERRVASLASTELSRAPGSGYEYANDGYSVAGLIVQSVSGMPYEDYLAAHVFEPLGMPRTTFDVARAADLGLATGYGKSRGVVTSGPLPLSRGSNPAGGVLTTAREVGNYFVALLNDGVFKGMQVISPASIEQMWTAQPATGAEAYGFGWGQVPAPGMRLLSHAGDIGGPGAYGSSGSQFLLVPEQHIAVGVLANMSSLEKAEVAQDVLSIVQDVEPVARPAAPDWRHTTFNPDRALWANYVGDYTASQPLRVYREGDRLLGEGPGFTIEFVPLSDTRFVMLSGLGALDEAPAEFQRQADGSIIFLFHGQPFAVKK